MIHNIFIFLHWCNDTFKNGTIQQDLCTSYLGYNSNFWCVKEVFYKGSFSYDYLLVCAWNIHLVLETAVPLNLTIKPFRSSKRSMWDTFAVDIIFEMKRLPNLSNCVFSCKKKKHPRNADFILSETCSSIYMCCWYIKLVYKVKG